MGTEIENIGIQLLEAGCDCLLALKKDDPEKGLRIVVLAMPSHLSEAGWLDKQMRMIHGLYPGADIYWTPMEMFDVTYEKVFGVNRFEEETKKESPTDEQPSP